MSKLDLKKVALIATDTSCHELTRRALEDCLKHADFGQVILFSDKAAPFGDLLGLSKFVYTPIWETKFACGQSLWYDVHPHVTTDHMLNIQWDSWIVKPDMWTDEFLKYDYVGAPWWYGDGLNVGNGGFTLRSKRLMEHLSDNRDRYPLPDATNEDQILCRGYRRELEAEGFKWAPDALASRFSIERTTLGVNPHHFGFHGLFNWPAYLEGDALKDRLVLAKSNEYISSSGMLQTLQPEYLI